MRISDSVAFFNSISHSRINSYKNYFGSHLSSEELIACYQWNETVSVTFFKVINLIEIILRNRFHLTLSNHFYNIQKEQVISKYSSPRSPFKYQNIKTLGTVDSCNWYETRLLEKKSLQKILDKTHHKSGSPLRTPIFPDDLVAGLTLGFWCSLIPKNSSMPWDQQLSKIFPNHRLTKSFIANFRSSPTTASNPWLNVDNVQQVSNRLELLNEFRNRIAHHEPLWKLPDLYDEIPIPTEKKGTVIARKTINKIETFQRLNLLHNRFIELLKWIDINLAQDYQSSKNYYYLKWLISNNGFNSYINRYQNFDHCIHSNILKRNLTSLLKQQESFLIYKNHGNIYALHPIT
ncbi:Abi family protein [Acinetobacter baumannii]|uniref:Abi family protein n=4 Tax=Acinetobacter baumannii TaxID=470 RepID=UPI000C17FD87|nr:Abi family protein [Acinetobacter baumannii]EKT9924186.1 Abi family protein [Acinetobacter baumannii]EKV9511186.1 Abi family protein [Acinetobacter baumannii]EKW4603472.1 Abi family protein [Acinetobacter baumannii]EKW4639789.1 Abi family protein [Acinetobacter baumannii]EKW5767171.1 Abi family protein [Acinetobacter baumannii]